ncbi:DUF6879 family protein [Streptomyces noursei]|uniref:DUF6879 family protein n=1 Tax=Streptomyces noursei TaxID=1971 RepID=UPI00167333F7|nr:DUF6879 family protein [Streptomyces noursei]MCZ1013929.1 hypothetical protein [Streptomyces noursei]GGX40803.1 hypothetical protein GCM10010341_73460 [Streptomyces noursei]
MPDLIPFSEVAHHFQDFAHTAWRLETRRGYASDRNGPKWQRFLRGEDITKDPDNAWRANVRAQVAAGKSFERVRLIDQPPTEGQRFLLASGLGNVAAGEDIRNLYRSDAQRLGLPGRDFWLFDSRMVAEFEFDDDDVTLGVRLYEDAETVVRACQVRDAAWHHAVPTRDFQARVLSGV